MLEVKRITTCTMPHGSRLNPHGTKHYSACMMDDMLAEIDTQIRRLALLHALGRQRNGHARRAARAHENERLPASPPGRNLRMTARFT